MELVADESVDFGIIQLLRNNNVIVFSIAESNARISDKEVMTIANSKLELLITEAKDFGELTHRLKLNHCGILINQIG